MKLSEFFGFYNRTTSEEELPDLFPLPVKKADFIKTDVINIFAKILTDVAERTQGLNEEQAALLWDNCLMSNSQEGLITLLSTAMHDRSDLFLIYDKSINLIRKATSIEQTKIKEAYKMKAEPADVDGKRGVFISFKNFAVADMVKVYSALEYCNAGSLNKQMNLANSLQIKFSKLRESIGLPDASVAEAQAKDVATALQNGRPCILDASDQIVAGDADVEPAKASSEYVARKLSFYLGLPAAYIIGEQTGGLNATGEIDQNAVERGLKKFYFSILKPAYEAIFEVKPKYKSQNFRQISTGFEAVRTFELAGDEYLTRDQKLRIVRALFDIEETEEEPDLFKQEEVDPVPELPRGQA